MEIDEAVMRFRLASRELFNTHFHVANGYENNGWAPEGRFSEVEKILFEKLVTEPESLPSVPYGDHNPGLIVSLRYVERAPIMVNRDVDGSYWDFPIKEVTRDARMLFIRFFDWDQLAYRDNQYVRVVIDLWPTHPHAVGRHALIETRHIRFERGA